jgi:NADH dehydrogenase/NADH:ubiquinone oxidoreductase subunit G
MKVNAAHELEEATGQVPRIEGRPTFRLDGNDVPFDEGQSILAAALAAGHYIPYLCYHPEFKPHGSCKVCTVKVNGRTQASCTQPAREGDAVESAGEELSSMRKGLVQFLFVEGNHFCPSCEASGNCKLQAVGYDVGLTTPQYNPLFPVRPVDASHPEVLLDFNRCILCAPACWSTTRTCSRSRGAASPSTWWSTRSRAGSRTPTWRWRTRR